VTADAAVPCGAFDRPENPPCRLPHVNWSARRGERTGLTPSGDSPRALCRIVLEFKLFNDFFGRMKSSSLPVRQAQGKAVGFPIFPAALLFGLCRRRMPGIAPPKFAPHSGVGEESCGSATQAESRTKLKRGRHRRGDLRLTRAGTRWPIRQARRVPGQSV
jgi:hypothetical protein